MLQLGKKIVDKYRQTCDVIHVRVSDDDVAHLATLSVSQGDRDAARIDRDPVIDEKTSETLR